MSDTETKDLENMSEEEKAKKAIEAALVAAAKRDISSAKIFDLLIYGTMREHGITRIATFNEKDFRNLDGIELVPIP